MYKRIELPGSAILGLRILKDVSDRENRELVELIDRRFRQHGPVRLLVIYEADPGLMGSESLYDNMRFAKQAAGNLSRMAVIGNHSWESTWIALFGLFGGIQAEYFSRSQYEAALEWLKA